MEQDSDTTPPEIVAIEVSNTDQIPIPHRVHSYIASTQDRLFLIPIPVIWGTFAGIMAEAIRGSITQQPDITLVKIGAALGLAFGVGEILEPQVKRYWWNLRTFF